jgi:hypothetical protein
VSSKDLFFGVARCTRALFIKMTYTKRQGLTGHNACDTGRDRRLKELGKKNNEIAQDYQNTHCRPSPYHMVHILQRSNVKEIFDPLFGPRSMARCKDPLNFRPFPRSILGDSEVKECYPRLSRPDSIVVYVLE